MRMQPKKKAVPVATIQNMESPENIKLDPHYDHVVIRRKDPIPAILLKIVDACHEIDGNDTRWKPIRDDIERLMK